MRLDEYLETVSEQIRYAKIRPTVTEELKVHILDQAESYEECGMFPEEALERAVLEMGDPVETGVALDRIHRPQMNWGIVAAIAVISILSIGIFYAANLMNQDMYPWQRQALFVAAGFLLMLLVCRLDYSILGKFGWKPALLFLLLMFLGWIFGGVPIHGARRWIRILGFTFSISEGMLLYVPLFGAALYSFRGEGYRVLLKVLPLIILPAYFVSITPDLSSAVILFTCLFCLFLFAVAKGWYQIHKQAVLAVSCGILILSPLMLLGYFYFFGMEYQSARIRAFFTQTGDANFLAGLARNMRESSSLIGSSAQSAEWFANGPATDFLTDYILVTMCSLYGTLLTVAIITVLFLVILKVFQISIKQKNQLGMIVGTGCGIVFLVKITISILMNLQMLPHASISMPFLSYGGSSILVSYILQGLVLSIYRYKNILPAKNEGNSRHHLRLKFI